MIIDSTNLPISVGWSGVAHERMRRLADCDADANPPARGCHSYTSCPGNGSDAAGSDAASFCHKITGLAHTGCHSWWSNCDARPGGSDARSGDAYPRQ
jgi:hypothetical protein